MSNIPINFFLMIPLTWFTLGLNTPLSAGGGYYRVTGNLRNIDNAGSALGSSSCSMSNVKLRFKSRWTGGTGVGFTGPLTPFPWGPSWGEVTTDSNGRFTKTSYFFPNATRNRDVLIEARIMDSHFNYSWVEVKTILGVWGAAPRQQTGNIYTFALGNVQTDLFDCPTTWTSQPNEEENEEDVPFPVPQKVKLEEVPCGWGPNSKPGIDLTFASVVVRHRDNQPDAPPERISWEVVVKNEGTATYRGSGKCKAKVRFAVFIPEQNKEREYFLTLSKSIAPGSEKTFTSNNGNLGEISEANSQSYNVLFEIDPDNSIVESNENNNQQSGAYAPTTQSYTNQ